MRYLTLIAATCWLVASTLVVEAKEFLVASPQAGLPSASAQFNADSQLATIIDEEIIAQLNQRQIPISPRATAHEQLRRVYLDLIGRLPSSTDLAQFEADQSARAYEAVVDRLLASDFFADYWTLKFCRWLQVHSLPDDPESTRGYTDWIHESIRSDRGIDDFTRQWLTSTGDAPPVGSSKFPCLVANPQEHAELVSRFFLGVRMDCADCHHHPLDDWEQTDFHGLIAIFSPGSNRPKIPAGRFLDNAQEPRIEFANWLLAADNRYFSRAIVNRFWQSMMGRGLVEPVDDLRASNAATHPHLLERLADDFVAQEFRLRPLLRQIAVSETYRRSCLPIRGNELDVQYYSHAFCRPLAPEVLADAIADVTGVPNQVGDHPGEMRAIMNYAPPEPNNSLKTASCNLGASGFNDMAETGSKYFDQSRLVNSEFVHSKLDNPMSFLHVELQAGHSDREIVAELIRRALGHVPDPLQLRAWSDEVPTSQTADRAQRIEDFLQSLLGCYSFTNNH